MQFHLIPGAPNFQIVTCITTERIHPLSDWYMENDEYAPVNKSAGMAYDSDNDAWVELGSTPGSTPVWWSQNRREKDSGANNWRAHLNTNPKYRELKNRLQESESQRAHIQSKREKAINRQKDNQSSFLIAGFLGVLGLFGLGYLIDYLASHTPNIGDIVFLALVAFFLFLAVSLFRSALDDSREAATDIDQLDKLVAQIDREVDELRQQISDMESAASNRSPSSKR